MVTHLYGILGVILDRTFGNIIRMLRVIRLPKEERGHLSWTFVGTLAVWLQVEELVHLGAVIQR